MFFDENNYRFGSITWARDLTQQEIKELEKSDPKANVAKTSSSSNQSNTEAVVKPDEGTIKKVSEPKQPKTTPAKNDKPKPLATTEQKDTKPKRKISDIVQDKTTYKVQTKSKQDIEKDIKTDIEHEKKYLEMQKVDSDEDPLAENTEISTTSRYHASITNAQPHPADVEESTPMSTTPLPDLHVDIPLPEDMIKQGKISDIQLEAVGYAIQAFETKLFDGNRQGFFLADGTGMGKGRTIAATIQAVLAQGHGNGKAVWISANADELFTEAKDHWSAIGNNPDDLFSQADSKNTDRKTGKFKRDDGVLFTAYSQLKTKDKTGKRKKLEQLKEWLGEDYDGLIVLDEAHKANNATVSKSPTGFKTKPSETAIVILELVDTFPNARILYSTATGATEVRNFALYNRLGLWGMGTAFSNVDGFISSINMAGLSGMELMLRDLKARGLYMARTLSYRAGPNGGDEDVTFSKLEHKLSDDEHTAYDKVADAWQLIYDKIEDAKEIVLDGYVKDGEPAKLKNWQGTMMIQGLQQKVMNNLITSFKAKPIIKDIKKQLEAGNSCVIQLTNTGEAELKKALDEARKQMNLASKQRGEQQLSQEDIDAFDAMVASADTSPFKSMIKLVEKIFPVEKRTEVDIFDSKGKPTGRTEWVIVKNSEGYPVIDDKAVKLREELIKELESIKECFKESALDQIINAFTDEDGNCQVAEITGRTQRLVHGKLETRGKNANEIDKKAFEDGEKRILIFSEAGSTGASYHAGKNFKNQQKRIHYILQPGWRADVCIQGMGRTHRTNQAHKPHYAMVVTDTPGEQRFTSTIARRLSQLGALTTGERTSATRGIFSENDNLENKYAQQAMDRTLMMLDWEIKKKLHFTDAQLSGKKPPRTIQVLNRILALSIDEQKKLWEMFDRYREEAIASAAKKGTLERRIGERRVNKIEVVEEYTLKKYKDMNATTQLRKLKCFTPVKLRSWKSLGVIAQRQNLDMSSYRFFRVVGEDGESSIIAARDTGRTRINRYTAEDDKVYLTYSILADKRGEIIESELTNQEKFQEIQDRNEAEALWNKLLAEAPKQVPEDIYLITGVILPVWDRLKASMHDIERIVDNDGKQFLGAIISKKAASELLQRFELSMNKANEEKYTPKTLRQAMDKLGMVAKSPDLNYYFKTVLVNGEKRIEVLDVPYYVINEYIKRFDAIWENIGNKYRLFVKNNDDRWFEELLNRDIELTVKKGSLFDDVIKEINSEIPDNDLSKNYVIHPFFRPDPDENPYIRTESNYKSIDPEVEKNWQESKIIKRDPLNYAKDFARKIVAGRSDVPELEGDDRLLKAKEWVRSFKREQKATVEEVKEVLRVITDKLTPDDYDLFERYMATRDLSEQYGRDPETLFPFEYTPETLDEDFKAYTEEVSKNSRVQNAIDKADSIAEEMREAMLKKAERLGLYDLRNKLSRKYYFRHLVLEYAQYTTGLPRPLFKNPDRRGYLKRRHGSKKNISSNWITAMSEVYVRMNNDTKIMATLGKMRDEYDVIDDLKAQAFAMNTDKALEDMPVKNLNDALLHRQTQAISRLFKMAKKGDLPKKTESTPYGEDWTAFVSELATNNTLEDLNPEMRDRLKRYIGWLAGLGDVKGKKNIRAVATARRFLRGQVNKEHELKKMLGDKYVPWQDLIPDDYTLWSPSDSNLIFSAHTVPENIMLLAMENVDELLGIPLSELGKALNAGGNSQIWCIPEKLAAALNELGKKQTLGSFGQINKQLMNGFKRWTLLTPVNSRLAKYNYRNFFGDLEAVLQGNPEALKYLPQAWRELTDYMYRKKIPTGTLREFVKRGGALTTEWATELEDWRDLDEFQHLLEQKKVNLLKLPARFVHGYVKMASNFTNWRESLLRYASFLAYKKQIDENGGKPNFYGMSKRKEVDVIDDAFDMAMKLSNENLGAYDEISKNMAWARDNSFLSFASWLEVNFTRTIQMYKNVWTGNSYLEYYLRKFGDKVVAGFGGGGDNNEPPKGNSNGGDFYEGDNDNWLHKALRGLKKTPTVAMRVAITMALTFPLWIIMGIFNKLNGENDKKLTPDVRNRPHLTLWTNEMTGETYYMDWLGSMVDFFETVPLDGIYRDVKDILDGRQTIGGMISNAAASPYNKLINNFNPYGKAVLELTFGKSLYPDVRDERKIPSTPEYLAQTVGLDWYYKALTGKPHASFSHGLLANSANPDEAAYWYIQSKKHQFQEQVLGKEIDAYSQTKRGEMFRYARQAASYKDYPLMRKYLREYIRAGGNMETLKASANTLSPLYGLSKEEQMQFMKWLSKEDRAALRRGVRYSERIRSVVAPK